MQVRIVSLGVVPATRTYRSGFTPIAFFDFDLDGAIRIKGAKLGIDAGKVTVYMPKMAADHANGDPHRSVTMLNGDVNAALVKAARAEYRRLGGREDRDAQ